MLTKAEKIARKGLSAADKVTLNATLTPRVTRCRLVKLFPSSSQRVWLLRWFKDARTTYNLAMAHLLQKGILKLPAGDVHMGKIESELQKKFVTKAGVEDLPKHHHKLLRTAKVPRQQAVKAVLSVFKAHKTREKKRLALQAKYPAAESFKRRPRFNPGFKRKTMTASDSISIEKTSFRLVDDSTVGLFPGLAHFKKLKTQPGIKALFPLQCDFKVHFRHGEFFLILPFRRALKTRPRRLDAEAIAAIDPGVRVPFTVYSPEGTVAEIGVNATKVLDKHIQRIHRGRARLADVQARVMVERETGFFWDRKLRKNQRRRLRRARKKCRGAEDKVKRVIRDFHYKTAHYLLQRFRTIVLPHTSSHRWRMNCLAACTKQRSMMLRHGMFASRLVQTASDYPGSRIIRCSEAYTSKQCGACGRLNDKLGGSKVFGCSGCGASADRDVHAARNILLRCLQ